MTVTPRDWALALEARPGHRRLDPAPRALLDGWAGHGWPAIVRRRSSDDRPDALPLGVPLPPSFGRLRCALSLPAGMAWRCRPVPYLAAVGGAAPSDWRPTLDAALALGRATGAEPRAYGSLLWGALTGLTYLGGASDLDLLWSVTAETDLDALLDGIGRVEAAGPVPVDGEILLPDGAGVNWRELHRARRRSGGDVLAKTVNGLSLRRAAAPWTETP